eukprot:4526897-Prymnesium_polylepis.1
MIRVVHGRLFLYNRRRRRCLNYRHRSFLEGMLKLLETSPNGSLPDVVLLVSMDDHPPCETGEARLKMLVRNGFRRNGTLLPRQYLPYYEKTSQWQKPQPLPVTAWCKSSRCESMLIPCFSMLHQAYRRSEGRYSYSTLVRLGEVPWRDRVRRIYWDMRFEGRRAGMKFAVSRLKRHRPGVVVAVNGTTDPTEGCQHAMWVHAEGSTWSMRLKNILLCGSLVIWFRDTVLHKLYHEYWHAFLRPGVHYKDVIARNVDSSGLRSELHGQHGEDRVVERLVRDAERTVSRAC